MVSHVPMMTELAPGRARDCYGLQCNRPFVRPRHRRVACAFHIPSVRLFICRVFGSGVQCLWVAGIAQTAEGWQRAVTIYGLIGLGLIFLLVSAFWLIIPALYGVPWVPTRETRIRRALELADLQPDEILYDLGAGDGRVLLMAAQEFGARAVGIEIGPVQCALGWLRIMLSGSRQKARIRCGNFYRADVTEVDVVFVYLTSAQITRLPKKLAHELRPGARVVSVAADFPDWQPEIVDRELLIFVYQMPSARS